jgi:hypothetical protein
VCKFLAGDFFVSVGINFYFQLLSMRTTVQKNNAGLANKFRYTEKIENQKVISSLIMCQLDFVNGLPAYGKICVYIYMVVFLGWFLPGKGPFPSWRGKP